jgi:hypothetical protein
VPPTAPGRNGRGQDGLTPRNYARAARISSHSPLRCRKHNLPRDNSIISVCADLHFAVVRDIYLRLSAFICVHLWLKAFAGCDSKALVTRQFAIRNSPACL